MADEIIWTESQIMAARAITLIKNKLYPTCDGCGYSANRQKCANDLGGYCSRHQQENVIATDEVINSIEKSANFSRDFDKRWSIYMPLHLYHEFSESEIDLLRDLQDAKGRMRSRRLDRRFDSLSEKQVVYYSSEGNSMYVSMTPRGEALLAHLLSTKAIDTPDDSA